MNPFRLPTGRALTGLLALGLALTTSACDSNEPIDDGGGDEELITQVVLRFQNQADASDVVTITATDSDGDGSGLVFSPSRVALTPGATYTGTIELNDTVNDESITDEIGEEAEDHLFRYTLDPSTTGTVTLTDLESEYITNETDPDLPVGLEFNLVVSNTAAGNADFNATLFHFDGGAVKASATSSSDERDIDIDFPVAFTAPVRPLAGR